MNERKASWLESANRPDSDFPVENLPFCRFRRDGCTHVGIGIGDKVLDLSALADELNVPGVAEGNLNLLACSSEHVELRTRLQEWLTTPASSLRQRDQLFLERSRVTYLVPFEVGDYTDFYASLHHATRVGQMFRPDNPILPNYKYVPIGYHGRASTLCVSGTQIRRPAGQLKADGPEPPVFAPCKLLDYELEVGFWVGPGNEMGEPIAAEAADRHLFGLSLVNDWSARDVQKWEYQPLGPFLAKSFATSVAPWVVTREALEPYRCEALARDPGDPAPLPYLAGARSTYNLELQVHLSTARMREQGLPPQRVSQSNLRDLYWTPGQLLTHHASNGCWMRCGDLLASGTVSGPDVASAGCLLERTWAGPGKPRVPVELPGGEERLFLADGDEVVLSGWAVGEGLPRLGFGECRGTVVAHG